MDERDTDRFSEVARDEDGSCRSDLVGAVSMITGLPPEIRVAAMASAAMTLPVELRSKLFVSSMSDLPSDAQADIFLAWMRACAKDLKFIERIAASAAFALDTEGFTRPDGSALEDYFERRLDKKPWLTPTELVDDYVPYHPYWARRKEKLLEIAQKVAKRVTAKLAKRCDKRGEKFSVRKLRELHAGEPRRTRTKSNYHSEVGLLQGLSLDVDALPARPETYTRKYFNPLELVEEYRELLRRHKVYDVAIKLAQLLLQFEKCPSVLPLAEKGGDTERDYLCKDKLLHGVLSRVPLLEHTVRVAREIIEARKADRLDVVPGLIAALAHDIGKIPEVRAHLGSSLPNQEHNIVAADFLDHLLSGVNLMWVPNAVTAVREHHLSHRESELGNGLYRAEAAARRLEIYAEVFHDSSPAPLGNWFRPEEYVRSMEPHINVLQCNRFDGVLWNGSLYCNVNFLYDHAKRSAAQQGVIDYRFARPTDRKEILLEIVDGLRSKGFIPRAEKAGTYHRCYRIKYRDGGRLVSTKRYLLEIRANDWRSGWLREMGARRDGYLADIEGIIPDVPDFRSGAAL
jgi:hypothetical protein